MCALIPQLQTKARLCLVIHAKELKRTTNTGRLALKSLINSEMKIRGEGGESGQAPLDLTSVLTPAYRSVLFYPSDEALELNAEFVAADPRPIQLIVPDGNWRQAGKVHTRQPELKDIPRVKIGGPNLAELHLRAEHMPEGMATLEAIAEAFAIIESAEVGNALKAVYKEKLHRTLKGRGIVIPRHPEPPRHPEAKPKDPAEQAE